MLGEQNVDDSERELHAMIDEFDVGGTGTVARDHGFLSPVELLLIAYPRTYSGLTGLVS